MLRDEELRDLEQEDNWDYEKAEKQPGNKNARAVVSVSFPREDFERVSEGARRAGMRTSEFIREAAMDRAVRRRRRGAGSFVFTSASLGSAVFTRDFASSTAPAGNAKQKSREDAPVTY